MAIATNFLIFFNLRFSSGANLADKGTEYKQTCKCSTLNWCKHSRAKDDERSDYDESDGKDNGRAIWAVKLWLSAAQYEEADHCADVEHPFSHTDKGQQPSKTPGEYIDQSDEQGKHVCITVISLTRPQNNEGNKLTWVHRSSKTCRLL